MIAKIIFYYLLPASVVSQLTTNIYPLQLDIPSLNVGPNSDVFFVRGFKWECDNQVVTTEDTLQSISSMNPVYSSSKVVAANLLKCLQKLSPNECASGNVPGGEPLFVNLVEGGQRSVSVTTNTVNDVAKQNHVYFFADTMCIGNLVLRSNLGSVSSTNATFILSNLINIQSNAPSLILRAEVESTVGYPVGFGVLTVGGSSALKNIEITGSPAYLNQALQQFTYTQVTGSQGQMQRIFITLSSPDLSQQLTGYITLQLTNRPVGQIATSQPPSNGSNLITGTTGSVGGWNSLTLPGTVSSFDQSKKSSFASAISDATQVNPSSIEVGPVQGGSIVVFFRFLGLTPEQQKSAIEKLKANCDLLFSRTGAVCDSLKIGVDPSTSTSSTSSSDSLSAGAIVGIVIGSTVAGVCALIIILIALSRSKKASIAKDTELDLGYRAPAPKGNEAIYQGQEYYPAIVSPTPPTTPHPFPVYA